MTEVYVNAIEPRTTSLLTQAISASDVILPTLGAAGDALQAGEFRVIIIDPSTDKAELAMVTSGQETAQWHVTRGIEDTEPLAFPKNSIVKHIWTVGALTGMVGAAVVREFLADSGGHYETLIGDGTSSSFTITHNLDMKYVQVSLVNVNTNEVEDCLTTFVDINSLIVSASSWVDNPPAIDSYRVICDSPSGILARLESDLRGQADGIGTLDETGRQPFNQVPLSVAFVASRSIPVLGQWDGQQATDAVIASGTKNKVTSSIVGTWAVGKIVHIRGAGTSGLGFASTVFSVSGNTATMVSAAPTAVSGATITIGSDDTAAWVAAQAQLPIGGGVGRSRALAIGTGISMLGNQRIYLPPGCDPRGDGAGEAIVQCFGANAQISIGPAIGNAPESHGHAGDFLIDGGLIATQPLLVNANNGTLDTAFVRFANGDALIISGQNYEVLNPNSAGNVGSCLVLDQGAGNIDITKPQLAFAGRYHIEVRASMGSEGFGFGIPEFCRIHSPQCEGSNSLIAGAPGLGCVHFTAGRWIHINDAIFYTDAYTGTHQSLVLVEGAATGRINPDSGYNVVGDLHFHNPTFQTGGGLGYGIEIDNVDSGGVAQQLFGVYRPYTLTGKILAIGLNKLERVGSVTPGLIDGEPIYA